MSPRHIRTPGSPAQSGTPAPIYKGPQAIPSHNLAPMQHLPHMHHAPNAALLIDFDNVTMGIRSDLTGELKNLLASDIIKGKVSVQRAYADWRRYPQYIVPLAESSIDMIMAPAYGSSKKNATDIRLSIDALELVFTRPEIGTFILLSGDSDFSSLVIKLKEYGKYVIGVGIRESSSDLLVMNCDEYYSYTALAGLVRNGDEEFVKRDPWELVSEAIGLMKYNGDVMRADRLKQVMQQIDPSFDEKNLGMAKFSRFITEAAKRGLVALKKMESGQLEVGVPDGSTPTLPPELADSDKATEATPEPTTPITPTTAAPRGRGRGRGRKEAPREKEPRAQQPVQEAKPQQQRKEEEDEGLGKRLTRDEAFDLLKATLQKSLKSGSSILASKLRPAVRKQLGRDSDSLTERSFARILKDAHDSGILDLRRRGEDYEVSMFEDVKSIADQLGAKEAEHVQEQKATAQAVAASQPPVPRGMAPRGISKPKNGKGEMPAGLLSIGIVGAVGAVAVPQAKQASTTAPEVKVTAKKAPEAKAPAAKKTVAKTSARKGPSRSQRPTAKK